MPKSRKNANRTQQRRARQLEAFAAYRREFPNTRFHSFYQLPEHAKQVLMEKFKEGRPRRSLRRQEEARA